MKSRLLLLGLCLLPLAYLLQCCTTYNVTDDHLNAPAEALPTRLLSLRPEIDLTSFEKAVLFRDTGIMAQRYKPATIQAQQDRDFMNTLFRDMTITSVNYTYKSLSSRSDTSYGTIKMKLQGTAHHFTKGFTRINPATALSVVTLLAGFGGVVVYDRQVPHWTYSDTIHIGIYDRKDSLVTDLLTHVVYTNEQQWGYNPKSNFSNYTIQRHRWMTSTTHAYRALYEDLKKGTIHSVARINDRLRNQ